MKAEELMLGDWVLYDGEPVRIGRISDISPSEEHIMVCNALEGTFSASPERLQPIPLSADILIDNGFRFDNTDTAGFEYYCLGERGSETMAVVKKSGLDALTDTDNGHVVWSVYAGDYDVYDKVLFVHTLQHALRMSEINKEITLKIE